MKISRQRRAISQSLDLFIIVGVVLAVGGVVASAATGLIGSAAATQSLQLISYSLTGTPSGTTDGGATLSLTFKNVGTSTVLIGPTFSVTLGTNSMAGALGTPACTPGTPTSYAGSSAVTFNPAGGALAGAGACTAGNLKGFVWTGSSSSVPLTPGQQLTFTVASTLAGVTGGTTTNLVTTGNTYQVTVLTNAQSIIQNIISQ